MIRITMASTVVESISFLTKLPWAGQ